MTINKIFKGMIDHEIIGEKVKELYELWTDYGCPEIEDGPTTETCGGELVQGFGGEETEDDVDAYNNIIEGLYELIDVHHIGSGI